MTKRRTTKKAEVMNPKDIQPAANGNGQIEQKGSVEVLTVYYDGEGLPFRAVLAPGVNSGQVRAIANLLVRAADNAPIVAPAENG